MSTFKYGKREVYDYEVKIEPCVCCGQDPVFGAYATSNTHGFAYARCKCGLEIKEVESRSIGYGDTLESLTGSALRKWSMLMESARLRILSESREEADCETPVIKIHDRD